MAVDSAHDSGRDSGISNTSFVLTASDGEPIAGNVRFRPDLAGPLPVAIFVHGFKAFKDWGWGPYIGEQLARQGFYAVAFNFSHNGVEGDGQEFTRLDRFARNTYSREVRELGKIVDAVADGRLPEADRADRERIGLLGHSRGGGIAILEASRDPRARAVVVWGAVPDFNRYTERQKGEWRRKGFIESKNMRTGQMMRLDLTLLEDLERNGDDLDITSAASKLARPLLIVHGEQDLTIRIEEGERLAAAADPSRTRFIRIPRTAHTLGTVHPFAGTTDQLEYAIDQSISFLRMNL
jgi:dipeptidyl aminopeptidase/acylaminoacyl peptidase